MSAKLLSSSDAPPTSAPSTSGSPINSRAFDGLTLPPYWMRIRRATVSSKSLLSKWRMKACASCFFRLGFGEAREASTYLIFKDFLCLVLVSLREGFTDTNDWFQGRFQRCQGLFAD